MSLCVLHGVLKPLTVTIGVVTRIVKTKTDRVDRGSVIKRVEQQGREVQMRTSSKRGAVLQIRQSPDSMAIVAGNSTCKFFRLS